MYPHRRKLNLINQCCAILRDSRVSCKHGIHTGCTNYWGLPWLGMYGGWAVIYHCPVSAARRSTNGHIKNNYTQNISLMSHSAITFFISVSVCFNFFTHHAKYVCKNSCEICLSVLTIQTPPGIVLLLWK